MQYAAWQDDGARARARKAIEKLYLPVTNTERKAIKKLYVPVTNTQEPVAVVSYVSFGAPHAALALEPQLVLCSRLRRSLTVLC
jgi:hypothetical protein